jgi:hypothetical protein
MPQLKRLFLARVYMEEMTKDCLMHLVQRFHPEQAILLRTQTANQIATHLLQLDSHRDKRTLHRQQLFRIIRTPEEDLSAALAKVQLCINAIYPANDPAYTAHRSNTLRAAILSFCSDPVAQAVMDLIRSRQNECLPLTDDEVCDYAVKYEEFSHMRPTTNLKFGRNVNNMQVATFLQLNSMDVVTNTIYPAYPSEYDNPYPAYQIFDPAHPPNAGHHAHISIRTSKTISPLLTICNSSSSCNSSNCCSSSNSNSNSNSNNNSCCNSSSKKSLFR